ncbi:MAG: Clp protease N-terminal domain-containing protein [Bacteroidota bacterium]
MRLSDRARHALQRSRADAVRLGHDTVSPEHLLLGVLHEGGLPVRLLRGLGVSVRHLRRAVEAALPARPGAADLDPALAAEAEDVLAAAERAAAEHGQGTVGPEWLLLAVLGDEDGVAASVLRDAFGVQAETVTAGVLSAHGLAPPEPPAVREPEPPYLRDRAASAGRRLSLVFDETATEEEVAEVLALLSELYRALGGDGLVILDSGVPAWDAEGTGDG